MRQIRLLCLTGSLFVAACSPSDADRTAAPGPGVEGRWYDQAQVRLGSEVFGMHCAACHGRQAEGAPEWQSLGPDGKYPPPPLNGSGHGWHHPLRILYGVIMNGSPGGQGNMPAWKGKLTDEEVLAAIAWFQSHWSPEIYDNWVQRDIASRK